MLVAKNPLALPNLIRRLSGLGEQIVHEAAIAALPIVRDQIQASFLAQTSPATKPWAPLKPKKVWGKSVPYPAGRQILKGLKEYFTVSISGPGSISARNSKWYTKFHYTGTKYMADRRFLPFPGEKTPTWEMLVASPVRMKINRLLGGK